MPYDWVDNDVALKHKGVTVYHVCKDDYACEGYRSYNFSLEAGGMEEDSFDVEELNEVLDKPVEDKNDGKFAIKVLKAAINQGLITPDMEDDDVFTLIEDCKEASKL